MIPKKIKIGRTTYKILIVKRIEKGLRGFIDYQTNTILIKDNKNKLNTFMHEVSHALITEIYLDSLGKRKDLFKLKSDEWFIENLGKKLKNLFL